MDKGIPPGISFDEFKVFCQFLNNLEDFTIAMRMYTLADHPISKGNKIKTILNLSVGIKNNTMSDNDIFVT